MKKIFKIFIILILCLTLPIWGVPYLLYVTIKELIEEWGWF